MDRSDLPFMAIAQLSRLIKQKELSPVELTKAYLDRIHRFDERLCSYITVLNDEAIAAARGAEKAIVSGNYLGPLHGIPVALKDNMYTKGIRTTAGSKLLATFVPQEDATVVERLAKAGAILIGKLNMTEFAVGGVGGPVVHPFGTPRNPWALDRSPGGTSSGSAIAVAAGLCAGALGSDTIGSIRGPASFCGVVGLRPTYGRVSRHGVIPRCWQLDTAGPLGRGVVDCALLLQAIAGRDPKDASSSSSPVSNYLEQPSNDISGLRIGLPKELWPHDDMDIEVKAACTQAVAVLEGLGAKAQEVSLPTLPGSGAIFVTIADAEVAAYHETWLRTRGEEYNWGTRIRLETGMVIPAHLYLKAQRARTILQQEIFRSLEQVDMLISATSPRPAPLLKSEPNRTGGRPFDAKADHSGRRYPSVASLTGLPAITVPCGFTKSGVPVGLQIVGRPFDEAALFRIGSAYEKSTPWHKARPPIS